MMPKHRMGAETLPSIEVARNSACLDKATSLLRPFGLRLCVAGTSHGDAKGGLSSPS